MSKDLNRVSVEAACCRKGLFIPYLQSINFEKRSSFEPRQKACKSTLHCSPSLLLKPSVFVASQHSIVIRVQLVEQVQACILVPCDNTIVVQVNPIEQILRHRRSSG